MSGPEDEPGFECAGCHELNRERLELTAKLEALESSNIVLRRRLCNVVGTINAVITDATSVRKRLRDIVDEPGPDRCSDRNEAIGLSGVSCERPKGHDGDHLCDGRRWSRG